MKCPRCGHEMTLDTHRKYALNNTKRVDRRLLLQRTFLFNRGLMRLTPEILSEVSAPGHADTQKRAFLFSNS